MQGPIQVIETATTDNFYDPGYILANPDVQAAGMQAKTHFDRHGQAEKRKQITREFLEGDAYRARKFKRFSKYLYLDDKSLEAFPVSIGTNHFSRKDYAAESANHYFAPFEDAIVRNPDKVYLDLGCGMRSHVYENCLYLEVYPSLSADVIVPAECVYPIADEAFDGIGSFAVLEHTRKPWLVVEEIHRMLKPGGVTYIDWPFLQPLHGYPSHFFNTTREGLVSLFSDVGFDIEEVKTFDFQGPDHAITWILGKFLNDLPEAQRKRVHAMSVGELLSHQPQDKMWSDLIASASDATRSEFAAGNTLRARKKA